MKGGGGFGCNCKEMSQDSEEIKTIEQWKWSEMQGLELVVSGQSDLDTPFKANSNHNPSTITTTTFTTTSTSTTASSSSSHQATTSSTVIDRGEFSGGGERTKMETSDGKKDGKDAEKPGLPPPTVGFGELFRFADGLDYVLMTIGTVGAFVHGCSLPLFLRFFADLVNSFGANANDVDKMTQEVVKV